MEASGYVRLCPDQINTFLQLRAKLNNGGHACRLNFDQSKNGIYQSTVRKRILKLVKRQSLVPKCCKTRKISCFSRLELSLSSEFHS